MLNSRVKRNNAAEKFFMGPLLMLLQPSFASSHIHFRRRAEREKNFFSAKHAIVLFVFFASLLVCKNLDRWERNEMELRSTAFGSDML